MLAIDLGKQSFHLTELMWTAWCCPAGGRAKLLAAVERLMHRIVAMEACATAHHWARSFAALGCERLIDPRFVKPFVRDSKNDAVDAEAILDAACQPSSRAERTLEGGSRGRRRFCSTRPDKLGRLRFKPGHSAPN